MRLKKITIVGFRCFGLNPVKFSLSQKLTALVGPNASGKTALLHALSKLFGVSRAQRTLHRSDFHLPPDTNPEDRSPRELFIDVLIEFPELVDGTATPKTIAPAFGHMLIKQPGNPPVCRMRLEARWSDDGTVEGEVSQDLYWVNTLESNPEEEQKHRVSAADRGLIQLNYTPASRDPGTQVRATAGALASRLLRAIEWSEDTRKTVEEASETLNAAFEREAAIKATGVALSKRWSDLYDEATDTNPRLSPTSRRFRDVISHINVVFRQGAEGAERGLDVLSEGQQSLFYFALAATVFDLERRVVSGEVEGFGAGELHIPALTIFALEEPENHLSPYYLSRILLQVRSLLRDGGAQAIVTSHSPSVLSRVKPREVRYCRLDPETRVSSVKSIKMPTENQEAAKFMRNAIQSFPELYFARFVLLVEGDSERIVLSRLARALSLPVDSAFVAIIPLGGRHVQHFWRLLSGLKIPYATLLDLDLGRKGGGFGRVKTVIERLLEIGVSRESLLDPGDDLEEMHTWDDPDDMEDLKTWVKDLQSHGVFFSSPLDFDLMMLEAFPEAYESIIPAGGGPKMQVKKAASVVLGTDGPGLDLYENEFASFTEYMPAYRYHFLTRSKPATHIAAMAHMKRRDILENIPKTIRDVLKHVAEKSVGD